MKKGKNNLKKYRVYKKSIKDRKKKILKRKKK
jgi:hypothetical protein